MGPQTAAYSHIMSLVFKNSGTPGEKKLILGSHYATKSWNCLLYTSLCLSGCAMTHSMKNREGSAETDADSLVVYSPHPLDFINPIVSEFEAQTGISAVSYTHLDYPGRRRHLSCNRGIFKGCPCTLRWARSAAYLRWDPVRYGTFRRNVCMAEIWCKTRRDDGCKSFGKWCTYRCILSLRQSSYCYGAWWSRNYLWPVSYTHLDVYKRQVNIMEWLW